MSGDWPPEWDDPEEEFPSGAEQQDTAAEARLAEVTAFLASVPAPVMPEAIAARISGALAVEAAARAADGAQPEASSPAAEASSPAGEASSPAGGGTSAGATPDGGRTLGAAPARARMRRHRDGTRGHHGFRARHMKAVTSVMAGLVVIAGIGYGISRTSGATYSSSSAASAAGSSSGKSFAAAAPQASSAASSATGTGSFGVGPQFVVTASGTKYQETTLAGQVRASLFQISNGANVPVPSSTSSTTAVGASKTAATGAAHAPTTALRACVLHLTGGQPPRLVDRATYQGVPAYVIATASHVWVVGLGCTAANAELITSVALGS